MGKISTTPLIDTPQGTDRLPVGRPGNASARTMSLDQVKSFAAADSSLVHKTGDETVTGQKRFGLAPLTPTDVCFWMDGQNGRPTLAEWQASPATVDVTSAFQAALDVAGSHTNPPTWLWQSQTHARAQGIVTLAPAANHMISATLVVPPGVFIEMNNATITQTGTGDALKFEYNQGAYGWGNYFTGARNGSVVGPGSGTSQGRGIFAQVVNFGKFENLKIKGFKFGATVWEGQYSSFIGSHLHENVVNLYITAQPGYADTSRDTGGNSHNDTISLTSIDNYFAMCTCTRATKYGVWLQCSSASTFNRLDVQKNGVVDVLIGAQLTGYITGYTVTNPGSGYAASTTIPAVITDATGSMAQAYATTNGAGEVTGVFGIDAGANYTNPTVTIPGGTATVTATVADDTGLGDWDGHSNVNRGKNVFHNLKVEHGGGERPLSGYAVIVNDSSQRQNAFYDLIVQREGQTGTVPQYFRWMRTTGYGTVVINPGDPSAYPSAVTNPAVSGDVSVFRSLDYQCLAVQWPTFFNVPNMLLYCVDAAGAVAKNGKVCHIGYGADGLVNGMGFEAQSAGFVADATGVGTSLTPVSAVYARNTTPATAGAPDQNSPAVILSSRSYYGGQDNEDQWAILNKATSIGNRGDLIFLYKNGAGAWTQNPLVLGGDGSVNANKATGVNNYSAALNFATTTAASASGSNGWSPAVQMLGRGWSSTSSASQAMTFAMLVCPEGGTTNPVGVTRFCYGTNSTSAAAGNELMRLMWGDKLGATFNEPAQAGYKFTVKGLPVYANNAAAVAGGLTAGAFYRTGGDPDLVCVVH